jgi:protein-S-isoprenylcysteine O-methyltransferase Ste14
MVSVLGLLWFGLWFFLVFPAVVLRLAGRAVAVAWGPLPLAGALLVVAGLGVVVVATVAFVRRGDGTPVPLDPPRVFLASGLHRYVRNPMYLAYATIVAGEALLFESPFLAAYAVAFAALVHVYVTRVEEKDLRRRFGADYRSYCEHVSRWVPKRPR